MRAIKNGKIRKAVDIDSLTAGQLTTQALDDNMPLKPFIEKELREMGMRGLPYTQLWNESEALRAKLKELTK